MTLDLMAKVIFICFAFRPKKWYYIEVWLYWVLWIKI